MSGAGQSSNEGSQSLTRFLVLSMPPLKNHKKRKAPARDVGGRQQEIHTHTHTFSVAEITGRNDNVPITTYVDRVSQDNRRGYRETVLVEPPSPVKRQRASAGSAFDNLSTTTSHPHSPDSPFDAPQCYEMGFDADDESPRERRPRPAGRAVKASDPALQRFRALRDIWLANMLRRDGRLGRDTTWCRGCSSDTPAVFRCQNCHGDELYCATCCVDRHVENPLHRIQRWNSGFFEPCTLKELGLRVQLGHRPREVCPEPHQLHTQFVVLHTNGIHEVNVDACDCEHAYDAGTPEIQMMRAGWFPATDQKPRTCATFEVLDQFLMATLQSKTTMYDFYAGLEKLTDNTGNKPPYRYHAGHDPAGVEATEPGELAIRCPCCPEPGVNLPEDWHSASAEDQYLYILFIALDACFRLKRRMVSSLLKDPPLGAGWAYLVEHVPYRKFLATATDQKEMNTCSGLAALDHANTKFSHGYYSTGVGMGVCARHEFVQPNGVGDLQKGERYVNMDWIFASILRHKDGRLLKIISYDIVCQWWKNLYARLRALPPLVRLNAAMALMRFVIPKMHIHSHTLACQLAYSLNLVPGSAQTDGEGIERPWANIGGVATSTREMGPGSREDVLNCHWSHWNWQKLVSLAERLRTRTDRANEEHALQLESFTAFTMQQADRVPAWKKMVEDFERDGKQKNPYEVTSKGLTEKDVLLRLEEEESRRVEAGVPGIHEVSPSSFIRAGLDVEDHQRRVRVQIALKKAATTAQKIDVVGLRRKLNRDIRRLRTLQATYTPASLVTLAARTIPESEQVETVPLFLPSALSAQQRAEEPVKGLAVIEDSMRDAQCATALARLRNQLHIKSRLYTYKRLQARNQGSNTKRRRTLFQRRRAQRARIAPDIPKAARTAGGRARAIPTAARALFEGRRVQRARRAGGHVRCSQSGALAIPKAVGQEARSARVQRAGGRALFQQRRACYSKGGRCSERGGGREGPLAIPKSACGGREGPRAIPKSARGGREGPRAIPKAARAIRRAGGAASADPASHSKCGAYSGREGARYSKSGARNSQNRARAQFVKSGARAIAKIGRAQFPKSGGRGGREGGRERSLFGRGAQGGYVSRG
ncbi:hypothetical protein B0H11DRAFT_2214098 [Mycena galericulata]|nr:hypothetical protein B0H11DRAFT_2214098 [Mycena galericulata]